MSDLDQDPFEQGKIAAANKQSPSSNRYPHGSDKHELWLEGFDYVSITDEDGEPKQDA